MGSNRHSRWIFFPSLTGFGSESGCTKIGFDLEISSIWYCGSTNLEPSRCCVLSTAERCMLVVSILERTAMQISCVQQTCSWSYINIYNAVEWITLRSQTEDVTFKQIFRTYVSALLGSDIILQPGSCVKLHWTMSAILRHTVPLIHTFSVYQSNSQQCSTLKKTYIHLHGNFTLPHFH